MSMKSRFLSFFGLAALMASQSMATDNEVRKPSRSQISKRQKEDDHIKLERHYQSCGLTRYQLRDTSGMPILNSKGRPLHVYALNKTNYQRKENRVISGDKSIPTFA